MRVRFPLPALDIYYDNDVCIINVNKCKYTSLLPKFYPVQSVFFYEQDRKKIRKKKSRNEKRPLSNG